MPSRILVFISCPIVVVLSACFLKPQDPTLEAQLEDSRIQASQAERRLQGLAAEEEKPCIACTRFLRPISLRY